MSRSATGAAGLRRLRLMRGLSQEQLAELAQVSERTVRTLESGTARRPHRDTLAALATALGLTDARSTAFLALWYGSERTLADSFADTTRDKVFHADFAALRAGIRDRTARVVAVIGADRRWHECHVQRTFQAAADGVDTFAWTYGLGSQSAADAVTLTEHVNLEVVSRVALADAPATLYVASLRSPLRAGELYSVSYRFEIGVVADDEDALDIESLFSVLAPMDALELEVRFDPAALPRRVWQVKRPTIDGDSAPGPELVVSPFGVVHLAELPAAVGVHGIRWEWDG